MSRQGTDTGPRVGVRPLGFLHSPLCCLGQFQGQDPSSQHRGPCPNQPQARVSGRWVTKPSNACVCVCVCVCVCKQMLVSGSETQVPKQRYFVLECDSHSHVQSKNRTCACWSEIKPQNGGLTFVFKRKFQGETSTGKTDKSGVVPVETGMGEAWRPSLCPHPHLPTIAAPDKALWNTRGSAAPGLKTSVSGSRDHGSRGPVL